MVKYLIKTKKKNKTQTDGNNSQKGLFNAYDWLWR